jgi:hypothetical protein
MIKKTKKNLKPKSRLEPVATKSVTIPLAGVIIFSILLAISSFFAGAAWLKTNGGAVAVKAKNTFEAKKSNKPEFQFYVMSFCPFGNDIEDVIKPVYDLLGKSADIKPQYIFSKVEGSLNDYCQKNVPDPANCQMYVQNSNGQLKSIEDCKAQISTMLKECTNESQYLKIGNNYYGSLHGRIEANQDVREICAYNQSEDKTNWWKFIDNVNKNCTDKNADTCWEDQAKQAGLDTAKITECFNNQAGELIEKEIALTTQNSVQGSPTLFINGVAFPPESAYTQDNTGTLKIGNKVFTQDQYRSPDAIKEAICASFNRPPKECKTTLETPKSPDGQVQGATDGGC